MIKILLFLCSLFLGQAHAHFSNESEASVVVSGGNSELETYNAKTINTYEKHKDTYSLSGHYTYGTSESVTSARNWDLKLRYGHQLSKKWSYFAAAQLEGDEFQGFVDRWNYDLGARYLISKSARSTFFAEGGYRFTREKRLTEGTISQSKGRLYAEGSRQNSKELFTRVWLEYLPNFTDSEDWIFKFEPSLNFVLNSRLTFKFGYLGTYDNRPALAGNKKFDFQYTGALVAKF